MTADVHISDEYMLEMLGRSKAYTAVLLRVTEKLSESGGDQIVWEHGRRNFELMAQGTLPIVCPATGDGEWAGVCIFDAGPEEVDRIMRADPGVVAGVFSYEILPVRGFPASCLP